MDMQTFCNINSCRGADHSYLFFHLLSLMERAVKMSFYSLSDGVEEVEERMCVVHGG